MVCDAYDKSDIAAEVTALTEFPVGYLAFKKIEKLNFTSLKFYSCCVPLNRQADRGKSVTSHKTQRNIT